MQWQINPEIELVFHHWDKEFLVFNKGSGDTHLLDEFAYQSLKGLEAKQADIATLTEYVAEAMRLLVDNDLQAHLYEVVEQLVDHQLIEPVK